jgi:hypothetical protein
MLKFFYKVILVSLMSGSLMLMDFSFNGIGLQMASAQSTQNMNSAPSNEIRTETLTTGVKSSSDIFATLAMTAVGTLASRLYKYKMTTDIMLAAAGGALFIGGEIVSFASLDSKLKEMETLITRDKVGNINQEQIKHLERLKQSYEEAIKTAGTKKKLQLAAAAAFAAAGVTAFTMATTEMAALTTCNTGIVAALATLKTEAAACSALTVGAAACLAPVTACATGITSYHSTLMAYELTRQSVAPSAPTFSAVTTQGAAAEAQLKGLIPLCIAHAAAANASLQPTCTPLMPMEFLDASMTPVPGGLMDVVPNMVKNNLHPTLKKYFSSAETKTTIQALAKPSFLEKTLNLFFPQADAALFSAMGLLSSAAVTYVLATSATLGVELDFFMLNPKNRTYVWAGLAATTALATTATDNQVKQIQENIAKIDKILNEMNTSLANGTNTGNTPNPANTSIGVKIAKPTPLSPAALKYQDIKLSDTHRGDLSTPCYTGDDVKKCKSFQNVLKDSAGYNNLNDQSQLELGNIAKVADGVNGTSTITSGTLEGAANLGSSSNALRSSLAKLQKESLEKLKKSGGKDDSTLLTKRFNDGLEKSVNAGLKKSNSTQDKMYSSMYGGSGSSAVAGSADQKKLAEETKKDVNIGGGNVAAGTFELNATPSGANLGLGLGKDSAEIAGSDLSASAENANGSVPIDDYDLKNDISNNPETSIFELISNRYQKSGYPRLLKLKENQPSVKN